jgi:hypothetical protein
MQRTADVEELAGHEIAFERGQKEHGADQIVFHLRALDAALLSANFFIFGIDFAPLSHDEAGLTVFTQKRGIFLDATLSACLVELTGTRHIDRNGLHSYHRFTINHR